MMKLSRRELLSATAAIAGGLAVSKLAFARPAFASVSAAELATDPRRPQYHLLPPANWMNDPNGPIYWRGKYHMFYQYNPKDPYWGQMHWGHATSPDMVHWKHLPVALPPTPGGPDADGCFSGTAVVHQGRPAVLYTGVRSAPLSEATIKDGAQSLRESQCLAYSDDPELKSWKKLPEAVIAAPPAGLQVAGFRDPSPWLQADNWLMAIGSGIAGKAGAVLLYRSSDLRNWKYLHPLLTAQSAHGGTANPVDSGDMWECPDFFPLGERHLLIYSTQGQSRWQSGRFDPQSLLFLPDQTGVLDSGSYYAAKTQTDKNGNRIVWGWIQETRPLAEYRAAGWAGLMSLPRILTLASDGRLRMRVAPEVHLLRRAEQSLAPGSENHRRQQLKAMRIQAACGEIACNLRTDSGAFRLAVLAGGESSSGALPCLAIHYDPSDPAHIRIGGRAVPLPAGKSDVDLELYIDSSVIETLVNEREAHTSRFYYPGDQSRNLRLKFEGDIAAIQRLSVWQIEPISPDRLTS